MKASLLAIVACLGCGVGDDPTGPDPNPNRVRCSGAFTTMGLFVEAVLRPLIDDPIDPRNGFAIQGCWPVGTWTFTATIDAVAEVPDIDGDLIGDRCGDDGTTPPTVDAEYKFRVERVIDANGEPVDQTTYLGTSPDFFKVKISEGGDGDCQGVMEMVSADKTKWWGLNPTICTSDQTRVPPECACTDPEAPGCCRPLCGAFPPNGILGTGDFTEYLEPQPF